VKVRGVVVAIVVVLLPLRCEANRRVAAERRVEMAPPADVEEMDLAIDGRRFQTYLLAGGGIAGDVGGEVGTERTMFKKFDLRLPKNTQLT
jgi:hypothetical protein